MRRWMTLRMSCNVKAQPYGFLFPIRRSTASMAIEGK